MGVQPALAQQQQHKLAREAMLFIVFGTSGVNGASVLLELVANPEHRDGQGQ